MKKPILSLLLAAVCTFGVLTASPLGIFSAAADVTSEAEEEIVEVVEEAKEEVKEVVAEEVVEEVKEETE